MRQKTDSKPNPTFTVGLKSLDIYCWFTVISVFDVSFLSCLCPSRKLGYKNLTGYVSVWIFDDVNKLLLSFLSVLINCDVILHIASRLSCVLYQVGVLLHLLRFWSPLFLNGWLPCFLFTEDPNGSSCPQGHLAYRQIILSLLWLGCGGVLDWPSSKKN
jgi:hypothetical protein